MKQFNNIEKQNKMLSQEIENILKSRKFKIKKSMVEIKVQ
jgi:hypothetical protein